jgi:integrase
MWRAVAKYRDYDGITRPVERVGESANKARNNLLEALRDRARRSSDGEIKPESKVSAAAELWLASIEESGRAARTKREYRDTWNRYLASSVGSLRICDGRVSTVNRIITETRDNVGRGAASHVKVVLSGVFALVVRHDAAERNPVREIDSLGKRKRKKERAINSRTIGDALGVFHVSPDAARWDLVDVLSGVGCRIGEVLALDWATSVDFDAGTIRFRGTVIRVTGKGLYVQDHTKSRAGMRHPTARLGDADPQAAARGGRIGVGLSLGHRDPARSGQHPCPVPQGRRGNAIRGLTPARLPLLRRRGPGRRWSAGSRDRGLPRARAHQHHAGGLHRTRGRRGGGRACDGQAAEGQRVEKGGLRQGGCYAKPGQLFDQGFCAPGRIRTCDTRFRRAVLYPLSYEGGDIRAQRTGRALFPGSGIPVRLARARCVVSVNRVSMGSLR